ncbi:Protein transport protein [Lachnellula occidentalis]|uniref:Protein transport protein SEC22 n=1 Tax=Lachnellula occidentalis TaxID=215460 RepID=A0A8H8RLU5_9HELO|nr:Protein transport protein [Lachnellula occidentalis]
MIKSTQIARLDGLMLCASVDDEQTESSLVEIKSQVKMILRKLSRHAEPQASIESGSYTIHYLISNDIVYICISERSYPRKLAFTYLSDLSTEFSTTYPSSTVLSPTQRPYAFMEFDTFISRTKATYSDTRATQNLDKLNDELRDVTKVMTKNIEDLLYRGDSLERMGGGEDQLGVVAEAVWAVGGAGAVYYIVYLVEILLRDGALDACKMVLGLMGRADLRLVQEGLDSTGAGCSAGWLGAGL